MVIAGDFKLELVEATTKTQFKEHDKDGQTYVEVEPDAEYYISVNRISRQIKKDMLVTCLVDNKTLGWQLNFSLTENYPTVYMGSMNVEVGGFHRSREHTALVFARPKLVLGNTNNNNNSADNECLLPLGPMLMGKVDFLVFERGDGYLESHESSKSEMARKKGPVRIATDKNTTIGDKKQVRSKLGLSSETEKVAATQYNHFWGKLLMKKTLNYCTVPGLIHAGVLSKPPNIYEYHRNIASNNDADAPIPPLLVQPQQICEEVTKSSNGISISRDPKYYDLFDLSKLEDDDDDDDDSGNDRSGKKVPAIIKSESSSPSNNTTARRPPLQDTKPDPIASESLRENSEVNASSDTTSTSRKPQVKSDFIASLPKKPRLT